MTAPYAKPPVEPAQFARNGRYPDANLQAEIADLANRTALYRLKEIARFGAEDIYDNAVSYPSADTERVRWRFAFQASPYAACIIVNAWMTQTMASVTADPYARVRIQTGAPATLGDAELHFGLTEATTGAEQLALLSSAQFSPVSAYVLDSNGDKAVPVAGTAYYGTISDFNRSRIVAISVYEGSLDTAAPFQQGHAVQTPIFDKDRQDILVAARTMWKQQAAHLFNFSVPYDANVRTRSSATPANIHDNSSTVVSTATPGYTLDLRNRSTVRRVTVPCVFKAYGSIPSGSGTVVLKDSTGTIVATATINSATPGWFSTTCNLPATLAKYDLMYAGSGLQTVSVYAASLYQSE
jgi:hypothetical protein